MTGSVTTDVPCGVNHTGVHGICSYSCGDAGDKNGGAKVNGAGVCSHSGGTGTVGVEPDDIVQCSGDGNVKDTACAGVSAGDGSQCGWVCVVKGNTYCGCVVTQCVSTVSVVRVVLCSETVGAVSWVGSTIYSPDTRSVVRGTGFSCV